VKCPACKYEWKLPGPQAGGRAKVAKGFAVKPLSAAARRKAWKTRKELRSTKTPREKPAKKVEDFACDTRTMRA